MEKVNQDNQILKPKNKVKVLKNGEIIEQEQFRVVINKDANAALEDFVAKVNAGFQGGQAARSDIANYVLSRLTTLLGDADIKVIQNSCFDDKEALASLSKSEDELPDVVKKAIREAYGLMEHQKKRTARSSQELSTDKSVDNSIAS